MGAAFAVGLGVAALGGAPASALAADDCPNAAVRAQQQSQHLPNCMAFEQVTPHEKGGAYPKTKAIADDGNGVVFQMSTMLGEQLSFHTPFYRTQWGATGWGTEGLLPSMDGPVRRVRLTADVLDVVASSQDLSRTLIHTGYPFSPNDRGAGTGRDNPFATQDLYLREPDGTLRWLVADPTVPSTASGNVIFAGSSPDLERIVLITPRQFDPRATVQQVYVWTADGVRLVSEMPNGMPAATSVHTRDSNGVSADARRVAFMGASGADQGVYVRFNVDDPDAAFTRRVAEGPAGEACTSADLVRLSADGRKVIFSCSNALLPGAPANANYVRDLDGGSAAVSLLGTGKVWQANHDFSRIYVVGMHEDWDSVWMVRDGVETRVATRTAGSGGISLILSNGKASDTPISPDGEYFLFESRAKFPLLGVDQGSADDSQLFRVSARTGALDCVTCRQDGAQTDGSGSVQNLASATDLPHSMADAPVVAPVRNDGTVLFTSTSGLVPDDTNGVADAYALIDGHPVLLSGGRGEPSLAAGISSDGSRFFVSTPDALVADDRDGGQYDLYVARVDGGKLVEAPPVPCTLNCQGPGSERPGRPLVGTGNVLSNGNLVEEPSSSVGRASASVTVPRSVRGSSTTVRVKVSGAGSIRVSGAGIRQATVNAKKAGTYRVTVRLSAYGAQQQRSRGRVATKLTARFTPKSGASVSTRKSITFVRATTKGGR